MSQVEVYMANTVTVEGIRADEREPGGHETESVAHGQWIGHVI
jgi:hypothetical protein